MHPTHDCWNEKIERNESDDIASRQQHVMVTVNLAPLQYMSLPDSLSREMGLPGCQSFYEVVNSIYTYQQYLNVYHSKWSLGVDRRIHHIQRWIQRRSWWFSWVYWRWGRSGVRRTAVVCIARRNGRLNIVNCWSRTFLDPSANSACPCEEVAWKRSLHFARFLALSGEESD